MTPALELVRPIEIGVRELHLRLGLRDQAPRLIDRRVGALGRRVVFGEQRVELGAVEAGEHLAFLHPVAVLGVELDDGEPVDAGGDLRFLARNQRARDEQAIDEFALDRRNDGDRRRLDHARRFRRGCGGAGQAAALPGANLVHERGGAGRMARRRSPPRRPPSTAAAAGTTMIRVRRIVSASAAPPARAQARRRTAP